MIFFGFSLKGYSQEPQKIFTKEELQNIATWKIERDSYALQNRINDSIISELRNIVILKDGIIQEKDSIILYSEGISNTQKEQITVLEKKTKRLKFWNHILEIVAGVLAAATTILVVIK